MPTARMIHPVDGFRRWPYSHDGTPQHVSDDEARRLARVKTIVEHEGRALEVPVFEVTDDDVW